MTTGVVPGLQSRCGARRRPGWVRFPHVPAILAAGLALGIPCLDAGPTVPGRLAAQAAPEPAAADTTPPVRPLAALGRSLVLPGWGQAAVDRPVRGAVYFGLETASLFMLLRAQARLRAAERAEPPDEDLIAGRRAAREDWIVLSVFVALASGVDAWVSTHFWDFEAEVEPPEEAGVSLTFRLRLPHGAP